MRRHHRFWFGIFLIIPLFPTQQGQAGSSPLEFHLRYESSVTTKPFTGRVYVLLSEKPVKKLPSGPRWFKTEPFFALNVEDWKPGQVRKITAQSLGFPCKLDQVLKGDYWIFAVMDINRQERSFVRAEGNAYSKPFAVTLDPQKTGPVGITIDQIYHTKPFPETRWVKFAEWESPLLSRFHERPVFMRAGVVLPKSFYESPQKRYPVLYVIPGFGGTAHSAFALKERNVTDVAGQEVLCVVLDPNCRWGHHVFADSENNGPWGTALCKEFIPYLEKTFRGLGRPEARLLRGHSSGGWSSLWLQITHPDFFGGVWATAPDPVDFRDFQLVNIYQPDTNIFSDEKGKERPLARKKGKVLFTYKSFSDFEQVLGHGGQLGSFEAVFSPKGEDGRPKPLWDRQTGKIDPQVAQAWKRYDIRLLLERNWSTLKSKLQGKIHVYMGEEDNYYLDGATRLLQQALAKLESDAVIELFPGRDHRSLVTSSLRKRITKEMADQLLRIGK